MALAVSSVYSFTVSGPTALSLALATSVWSGSLHRQRLSWNWVCLLLCDLFTRTQAHSASRRLAMASNSARFVSGASILILSKKKTRPYTCKTGLLKKKNLLAKKNFRPRDHTRSVSAQVFHR